MCAATGVDWVLLDLEHGAGGEEQVGPVVVAAGAYGVPTVVRVESAERIRLGRVLDQGAAGVMLPRLDSAEEVAAAIRHLRYPPEGDRGVATYNRACRFGLDPAALDRANTEVLAVVQIESARAVEQVAEIAALDGVDVLFVGPRDLSHDLGVPGDVQAPSYLEALDRVRSAAQQFGKSCGLLVPDWCSSGGEACAGLDVCCRRLRLHPVGHCPHSGARQRPDSAGSVHEPVRTAGRTGEP